MEEKQVKVIAKCVNCGEEREISAGEILKGEHPMCDKCFMPMIAKETILKSVDK